MSPHAWADEDRESKPTRWNSNVKTHNRPAQAPRAKPRRKYVAPSLAKPCYLTLQSSAMSGVGMFYNPNIKVLTYPQDAEDGYTSFPSHKAAKVAIWKTIEYYNEQGYKHKDGTPFFSSEFKIIDE